MGKVKEVAKHAVQRAVSTTSVYAIIAAVAYLGYTGYIALIKPHFNPIETTKQEAEKIVNYNTEVKPRLGGCAHVRIIKDRR